MRVSIPSHFVALYRQSVVLLYESSSNCFTGIRQPPSLLYRYCYDCILYSYAYKNLRRISGLVHPSSLDPKGIRLRTQMSGKRELIQYCDLPPVGPRLMEQCGFSSEVRRSIREPAFTDGISLMTVAKCVDLNETITK
jgi:hypothetical protein